MRIISILPTVGMLLLLMVLERTHLEHDPSQIAYARKLILNIVLVVALYHGAVEISKTPGQAFQYGATIGFFLYIFHAIACEYDRTEIAKKTAYGTVLSGIASIFGFGLWLISHHTNGLDR